MNSKFVLTISLIILAVFAMMPQIPQDPAYHQFADDRTILGVANFFNVISNLPFVLAGLCGLGIIYLSNDIELVTSVRYIYTIFFAGLVLVGFGSAYYHLSPENSTLVWDRLPIAVTLMSFFCIVVAEYIDEKLSRKLFVPLLVTGLVSVLYWYWSEQTGRGDLSAYILVQFIPIIIMPAIFVMRTSRYSYSLCFWLALICYVIAKGFELFDFRVYEFTGTISGHSLKHLVAALGPVLICLALVKRVRR